MLADLLLPFLAPFHCSFRPNPPAAMKVNLFPSPPSPLSPLPRVLLFMFLLDQLIEAALYILRRGLLSVLLIIFPLFFSSLLGFFCS